MIAPALLALLGLGPALSAPHSLATVGARSELRLREGDQLDAAVEGDGPAWDVDNTASAGVAFDWRRTRLSLTYSPRLVFTDFEGPSASRDLTQAADLVLTNQSNSYMVGLTQRLEYGHRRFTALARSELDMTTGRPITNTVPGSESVLFAASATQAALRLFLSRRSELGLTGSYLVNGGVDAESRRTLPLVAGPRFDAAFTHAVTARDSVGLALSAIWLRSLGTTETGSVNTGAVTFGQRWDRAWRRELRSSLTVGEALLFDRGQSVQFLPQAFATLTRAFAGGSEHGALDVSVGAGTTIDSDRLTGTVRPSVQATSQVVWTAYPLRTYVLAGALKTISSSDANAATVFTADVGGSYQLLRPLALELGVRLTDQSVDSPTTASAAGAANGFAFAAFVALAWRPLPWPL